MQLVPRQIICVCSHTSCSNRQYFLHLEPTLCTVRIFLWFLGGAIWWAIMPRPVFRGIASSEWGKVKGAKVFFPWIFSLSCCWQSIIAIRECSHPFKLPIYTHKRALGGSMQSTGCFHWCQQACFCCELYIYMQICVYMYIHIYIYLHTHSRNRIVQSWMPVIGMRSLKFEDVPAETTSGCGIWVWTGKACSTPVTTTEGWGGNVKVYALKK